jgi:D-alanine transaminase
MSRVAYVNGRYLPHAQASVHIEDRGFQFADGVYEVWAVFGGRLAEFKGHMDRLERSLDELRIRRPMARAALAVVLRETIRRNAIRDGIVYIQVTRGQARRDHAFPTPEVGPSVIVTARAMDFAALEAKAAKGVAVITQPDIRWGRCDIKTVGLLPNALAKQAAREAGAYEAWLVDDLDMVTEGSSTNAWIVDPTGPRERRGAVRTALHRGRGQGRSRGLPDLGLGVRDAGREHRWRKNRRRRAGGSDDAAAGPISGARPAQRCMTALRLRRPWPRP